MLRAEIDGVSNDDALTPSYKVLVLLQNTADDSILDLFITSSLNKYSIKFFKMSKFGFRTVYLPQGNVVQQERETNQANETARVTADSLVHSLKTNRKKVVQQQNTINTLQTTGDEKNLDEALQLSALLEPTTRVWLEPTRQHD